MMRVTPEEFASAPLSVVDELLAWFHSVYPEHELVNLDLLGEGEVAFWMIPRSLCGASIFTHDPLPIYQSNPAHHHPDEVILFRRVHHALPPRSFLEWVLP